MLPVGGQLKDSSARLIGAGVYVRCEAQIFQQTLLLTYIDLKWITMRLSRKETLRVPGIHLLTNTASTSSSSFESVFC
jgi:hypothetical protein